MKPRLAFLIISLLFFSFASAQYYIRGEVKDEKGRPLQNVNIFQNSTQLKFRSGYGGSFGITSTQLSDSLVFSIDGFEPVSLKIKTTDWLNITMKSYGLAASSQKNRLISLTQDLPKEIKRSWFYSDESYQSMIENDFVATQKFPLTSLVLNVDKASYSNIRRFINSGSKVPPDAVRIEEMLNYFSYDYKEPEGKNIFDLKAEKSVCPWNTSNDLLYLNISARKANMEKIPPSNLVFLIDISGSMDLPNKLPLLKTAFRLLVKNLRAEDTVSIVVYGSEVGIKLYPTTGAEKDKIIEAIDDLTPGGGTPGEAAIRIAYELASHTFIKNGNNRVILATDGDFNIGATKEKDLEDLIVSMRQSGVSLTCLGVGMGNYKDSKLYVMAKKGNGNIAYIDNVAEAEKVLVQEFFQTLYAVAQDVVMKVRFNDGLVSNYRLIGFDNRKTNDEQFIITDKLDGGEVGSGCNTIAAFELVHGKKDIAGNSEGLKDDVLASIDIAYRMPSDTIKRTEHYNIYNDNNRTNFTEKHYRFANCVIMFGSLLRNSKFTNSLRWNQLLQETQQAINPSDKLQVEFLTLVQKAMRIYKDEIQKEKKIKR